MEYSFNCYGHENITSKHKTTLEFTKDKDLGLEGDCIVGVKADFQLNKIKEFIKSLKNNKKITITIQTMTNNINEKIINNKNNIDGKNNYNEKFIEKINAEINKSFNSDKEMVIRKSDFIDERTFAIKADKAAFELNRDLIKKISKSKQKITVSFD